MHKHEDMHEGKAQESKAPAAGRYGRVLLWVDDRPGALG